jgi:hypothetical protein
VIDFSVNVWDVRRPYIPFASFEEHKNVATGTNYILCTAKPAHEVTSFKQSPVLKGHLFLILSY